MGCSHGVGQPVPVVSTPPLARHACGVPRENANHATVHSAAARVHQDAARYTKQMPNPACRLNLAAINFTGASGALPESQGGKRAGEIRVYVPCLFHAERREVFRHLAELCVGGK